MKKSIIPFIAILTTVLVITTCNDREDYFANANLGVTVALESPLTGCTESHPGFIGLDYAFDFTLAPEYSKANPLPLVAKFACENASGNFVLSMGNKPYTTNDTIIFKSLTKKMKLNVSKAGTYKFLIQLFKENNKDEILGKYEFTFVIGSPDLNMYIVRDGKRVENMEETANFLGYEGSFIVRVNSDKEELNRGRLKLTANITGASVQVKNWKDKETKISQADDLPETVDFLVEYKNIQQGKTKFVFTAESQNSSATLRDSMEIKEAPPGSLVLQTTYNEEKKYYSRGQLWVGQVDSVAYLITPDPKAVSDVFRMKFEMKDPTKLWLFNTGDPEQHYADKEYEPNKWYDFSGRLTGKIYIIFPSPQAYSDTINISLQNGDMGPITKYKLFVSCKQSTDFKLKVTFKPLVGGYDEIKLSELTDGILDLVTLQVVDENPYSKFDYNFGAENVNELRRNIIHRAKKTGYENMSTVPFSRWLADDYGYLTNTKSFNIVCLNAPNNETAPGYVGEFNWIYEVKRMSDGKTKTETRQIKIIDDRMNFEIVMAPEDNVLGKSRESAYQNETVQAYQLKYLAPSQSADDYKLTVSSSNTAVADVYLIQKDLSFIKAPFDTPVDALPASHSQRGTELNTNSGLIRIKGKQPGTATLTFKLTHKTSGTSNTIIKTVTTIEDPVQYVIEPAKTIDAMGVERDAIPFGEQFHRYQNPRFKIRLLKKSEFEKNTDGTASVIFSTTPSINNVAKLTIRGGSFYGGGVAHGSPVQLAYDTDYFITVTAPTSHPWNVGAGSEQFLNIKMTKATNQDTKIVAEYNGVVKYKLREYQPNYYSITGEAYNESGCTYQSTSTSDYPVSVEEAGVKISPVNYYKPVTIYTCNGTVSVKNAKLTSVTWKDGADVMNNHFDITSVNGYYSKTQTIGDIIEKIEGQTPPDPNWNYMGPGVTVTSYGGFKTTVRDNWNYPSEVHVIVPTKIIFGSNPMF